MTNEIDWTKAPEGATHYYKNVQCFYRFREDGSGDVFQDGEWGECSDIGVFRGCLILAPTPALTKEFRVRGGSDEVWQKCKIVFVGKRYTVVENENGKEFSRRTAKITIRDIEPPIELIDSEFYSFEYDSVSYRGIYSKKEDRFIFAGGHVMASYCTNIKLLEIKS